MKWTTYRGEFRTKGKFLEEWRPFYGSVRLLEDDGKITQPSKVTKSVENMREAIAQWDKAGRYDWRIIGCEMTSREWTEEEL